MSWTAALLVVATAIGGQDLLSSDPCVTPAPRAPAPALDMYDGSAGELTVRSPKVESSEIRVDGALDEELWERAALLQGFTQYEPIEGAPATQRTEVLLLVSDDHVMFGVRAYDEDPGSLRANLSERDEFTRTDDYVRLVLDTFNDQRRAYVFTVNPLGVQHDGLWVEGGGGGRGRMGPPIDDNPDFVWQSGGQVQPWGYSVEVRIPFKSLRFPDRPLQDWGLQVIRRIQRNGYQSSWAPVTQDIANGLAQAGTLGGLEDLDPGLFMEINPVVTGNLTGAYDDDLAAFQRNDPAGEVGLNLTYGLTSNLTLDGTVNPDFSQVESDAGQILVNERFALFFPERRPFFLEGTEIFQLPKNLVYTRSVVNPVAGAKLTGKVGSFNVGYLGAVDEVGDEGDHPVVNLLRVRKDLGANSNLGLTYTDRTQSGRDFNRVAAADGRFIFNQRYTLQLLAAGSRTADSEVGGGPANGSLLNAQFRRSGRTFSFSTEFEDITPDFLAGSGFIRRVGITQIESRASRSWFGAQGARVESVSPSLELRGLWDRDAFWAGEGMLEASAELSMRVSFRNNFTVFGNVQQQLYDFPTSEYEGFRVGADPESAVPFRPDQDLFGGLNSGTIGLWASGWQRLRGNMRFTVGETPLFGGANGVPADLANSFTIDGSVTTFPVPQLRTELGLRRTTLTRKLDGSEYSTAVVPRIRAQYQFSRFVFARAIGQYSSQERGDLLDPRSGAPLWDCSEEECALEEGSDANDFSVEALLGYEPTPGTVFFLGYTRQMRDTGAFRFSNVQNRADGLFLKASYRFRM